MEEKRRHVPMEVSSHSFDEMSVTRRVSWASASAFFFLPTGCHLELWRSHHCLSLLRTHPTVEFGHNRSREDSLCLCHSENQGCNHLRLGFVEWLPL